MYTVSQGFLGRFPRRRDEQNGYFPLDRRFACLRGQALKEIGCKAIGIGCKCCPCILDEQIVGRIALIAKVPVSILVVKGKLDLIGRELLGLRRGEAYK
jgi:hypothetical protein